MIILKGLLRWGASFLLGLLPGTAVGVLRLDVLPALVLAFAAGCIAARVATPGQTQLADVFSLTWLACGVAFGPVLAHLSLGVPIEFFAGWLVWLAVAGMAGFGVVSVPRTAEENSFFGRIRRRWRGRS